MSNVLRSRLLGFFVAYTVFALCFQGTFYLFDYRNGDTLAPTYVKLLKDFVWVIVLSIVFYAAIQARKADTLLQPYNVILLSFCVWVVAVKLVELFAYGTYSVCLLTAKNLILYAAMVPLLGMLGGDIKRSLAKQVLLVFVAVALAQTVFSAALFISFPEHAFWKDDPHSGFNPFIGLFSNPNRFGLFLNLAAAVLCSVLVSENAKRALLAAIGLLVLALSIFYTAALSQMVVHFGILSYATAIVAWKMRWRSLRLPAMIIASIVAIGFVGLNFKSPLPDESPNHKSPEESELVWNLRNFAALALHGKTLDGEPFRFTSDTIVNRLKELDDLQESLGFQNARPAGPASGENRERLDTATSPHVGAHGPLAIMEQRLFGRPEQMAPASQSQFAYIYFRYGLVGLLLFVGVLAIPAVRSFLTLMRRNAESDADQMLLSCHLCLVVFMVTFLGDNGLLDYPTNFLLFFVLFANQSLVDVANTFRSRGDQRSRATGS